MKLQGAAKKDPASALSLIEKELDKAPFNDGLHDCLLKMELFDSAAFALETVRKSHPENTKSMHKLALFYLERGRADAAGDVYNDILKAESNDAKAIKGSKDCAAQHSMQRHNWSEHSSVRDLMKDQSEFQELEATSRAGMTKDQMYEKRDRLIAHDSEDPNNLGNGDAALKTKGLQMSDQFIAQQMATFSAAVEADPDNAKQRVDENPTDPQMRFELGSALYNAGDQRRHSPPATSKEQSTHPQHSNPPVRPHFQGQSDVGPFPQAIERRPRGSSWHGQH